MIRILRHVRRGSSNYHAVGSLTVLALLVLLILASCNPCPSAGLRCPPSPIAPPYR